MTTTTMDALIIGIPTGLIVSFLAVNFIRELIGSDES